MPTTRDPKLILDVDTADEVADLLLDRPGTADESVLDQALTALSDLRPTLGPDEQQQASEGSVVVVELSATASSAVETLIRTDEVSHPRLVKRIGGRLRSKVDSARRRRAQSRS